MKNPFNRPKIGILLDYVESGTFSTRPHYALRQSYFDAVWHAHGLPVAIPYINDAKRDYLTYCDGLILPGGFYPFPTSIYGESAKLGETIHPRYAFEQDFVQQALDADTPILGICAGMQILAASTGATLYRDVRNELPTNIDHLNAQPAESPAHEISIVEGTHLNEILGTTKMVVNTAHKEALKDNLDNLTISATSEDGVIEGIELTEKRFCVGVQWHPEFFAFKNNPNFNLFTSLIKAADLPSQP
ncbi:MAG: hypothetical protein CBB68_00870 [Rhodospirillaceae bacterium TMED8]|nr:gamma-glutamyl-gamma-aminobutyrate hydrolase [Magnetovibrio sp.]OUT53236.1 MAG: hypothetical protein CBB68_00870 [Rhodospirillaceae bacterium TMED8]|tara:strand:- start:143 stop:880 length:738 start_codon:yes stop_codon:yes gene_type:complete